MTELERYRDALALAGKLAIAAGRVTSADVEVLSNRVADLKKALSEYDDYIIDWSRNEK